MTSALKIFCITVPELEGERAAAEAHFKERNVPVEFISGIHGVKSGIATTLSYEFDNPGSGFNVGPKIISLCINHLLAWTACSVLPADDMFLILEADAKFEEGWEQRLTNAISHLPADWDMLYVGSCNCAGKEFTHVGGCVYRVNNDYVKNKDFQLAAREDFTDGVHQTPQCTQAILYSKKGINACIETQRKFYVGVDLALIFHTIPKVNCYVVLPRLISQHNPDVMP